MVSGHTDVKAEARRKRVTRFWR